MDLQQLGAAIVAAFVVMQIINAVVRPLWDRFQLDTFWLLYVALGIGGALGWFTGINALPVFGVEPLVGRILTCLVIGLGPSFIYELVKGKPSLPANVTPSYYEHG